MSAPPVTEREATAVPRHYRVFVEQLITAVADDGIGPELRQWTVDLLMAMMENAALFGRMDGSREASEYVRARTP